MQTHTYAKLAVSQATFDEIWKKLKEACYTGQLHTDGSALIDMHGIALVPEPADPPTCENGHVQPPGSGCCYTCEDSARIA